MRLTDRSVESVVNFLCFYCGQKRFFHWPCWRQTPINAYEKRKFSIKVFVIRISSFDSWDTRTAPLFHVKTFGAQVFFPQAKLSVCRIRCVFVVSWPSNHDDDKQKQSSRTEEDASVICHTRCGGEAAPERRECAAIGPKQWSPVFGW